MFFILVLALTTTAQAQIAVYGTFTGGHLGSIRAPYPYTQPSGFYAVGGSLGLYDDFFHLGPVHIGADLRGSILNSKGNKLNSGLVGLRVAIKPPVLPIKPYLQASIGGGSTNFGANDIMTSGLLYQLFGGLDLTMLPHLDWRVVDFGAGQFNANSTNYPVQSLSTGIVFRLP